MDFSILKILRWLGTRVGLIYLIVLVFCLTCVDLKMLETRVKIRHLNDSIPDFADMIVFSKTQNPKNDFSWHPYDYYFKLVLRYMPDDLLTRQLLGYVDYNEGHEEEAIDLFKKSGEMNGQSLFWSNYNLGVIYYKKGLWAQAGLYLLKAIESNPKLTVLLMKNSMMYRQISLNPYFKYSFDNEFADAQSHAYILLLSSLYNLKQYDKMLLISNVAIANNTLPYKDAFYTYAGLAFFQIGQVKNALISFQKSLNIEKNNPDVYYYIADIYRQAGQLDRARDFLRVSYALHQRHDPRFPYESQVDLRFF